MTEKKEEKMVTYLITHDDKTERRITVPETWKVTFGPAVKGERSAPHNPGGPKMPMALRFYKSENQQRAIFTDVKSFRDMSIKIEEKRVRVQEKDGYYECEGARKRTTFQATTEEWVDPDKLSEKTALPMPKDSTVFDINEE